PLADDALNRVTRVSYLAPQTFVVGEAKTALLVDHVLEIFGDLVECRTQRQQMLTVFSAERSFDGIEVAQCAADCVFKLDDGFVAGTRCEIAGAAAHSTDIFL